MCCSFIKSHLFDSQVDTDVMLQCRDGESIGAHRAILAARSPYFHSILGKEWRASKNNTIDMKRFGIFN